MTDSVIEIVEVSNQMPLMHQFVKVVLAAVAALAATKLVEKGYDSGYEAWTERHPKIPTSG